VLPLAPVQTGGLITGILGTPSGTDANGLPVGGGAITSFAFNSLFASDTGGTTTVAQARQWSLTDAMGASSAAPAYALQNQLAIWEENPLEFAAAVARFADELCSGSVCISRPIVRTRPAPCCGAMLPRPELLIFPP
jgi:hypothetical protein